MLASWSEQRGGWSVCVCDVAIGLFLCVCDVRLVGRAAPPKRAAKHGTTNRTAFRTRGVAVLLYVERLRTLTIMKMHIYFNMHSKYDHATVKKESIYTLLTNRRGHISSQLQQ